MRTIDAKYSLLLLVLTCTMFFRQTSFSQNADSLCSGSHGSVQFQLLGGLGVYYTGNWGSASYFRVGLDGAFNHSDNSGDGNSFSTYASNPGLTSSTSSTSKPDQNSTSYSFSISGMYVQKIAGYANATLYAGAGPMASYSNSKSSSATRNTGTDGSGTHIDSNSNEFSEKTFGVGPLTILGIRSPLLSHVGLSAELSFSALYQWTSRSNASHGNTSYDQSGSSSNSYGDSSNLKGWSLSLSGIRIGVIVEL